MKKLVIVLIVLALLLAGFYLYQKKKTVDIIENENPVSAEEADVTVITPKELTEENFSGTIPVIEGSSALAHAARTHVNERLKEFKTEADAQVPRIREDFGADSPSANYSLEMSAAKIESDITRSIVISEYVYTGGAHGGSSYKVITASKTDDKILALGDVIENGSRPAFTKLVQEKLLAWRPDGGDSPVVFPEDVKNLTFENIPNWALSNESLILHFSQYEVGPGVLGAFEFPIPRSEIIDYMVSM